MVFHYGTGPIIQNIVLLFTIIIATKNCHHSVNTSSILPKPFGKVAKIIRYTHNRFKKSFGSIPKKFSYLTYQRLLYHTNCSRIAKMVPSSPPTPSNHWNKTRQKCFFFYQKIVFSAMWHFTFLPFLIFLFIYVELFHFWKNFQSVKYCFIW